MEAAVVFLPLLGAAIAGLFGRVIGDRLAQLVTCTAPGAYGIAALFDTVLAPLVNAERPPRFTF